MIVSQSLKVIKFLADSWKFLKIISTLALNRCRWHLRSPANVRNSETETFLTRPSAAFCFCGFDFNYNYTNVLQRSPSRWLESRAIKSQRFSGHCRRVWMFRSRWRFGISFSYITRSDINASLKITKEMRFPWNIVHFCWSKNLLIKSLIKIWSKVFQRFIFGLISKEV